MIRQRGNATFAQLLIVLTMGAGIAISQLSDLMADVNESALDMVADKVNAIHLATTRYVDVNCDNPLLPVGVITPTLGDLRAGGHLINESQMKVRESMEVAIEVANRATRNPIFTYTVSGFNENEAEYIADNNAIATQLPDGEVRFDYRSDGIRHATDRVSVQNMELFDADECS